MLWWAGDLMDWFQWVRQDASLSAAPCRRERSSAVCVLIKGIIFKMKNSQSCISEAAELNSADYSTSAS